MPRMNFFRIYLRHRPARTCTYPWLPAFSRLFIRAALSYFMGWPTRFGIWVGAAVRRLLSLAAPAAAGSRLGLVAFAAQASIFSRRGLYRTDPRHHRPISNFRRHDDRTHHSPRFDGADFFARADNPVAAKP